jgi:L-fucose isomerase-like protein
MQPLTAGYVSLGTEFYVPDRLIEISADSEKQLRNAGIDLVRTDPVFALGQEERAIAELKSRPWDFLIINVINWIDPRAATRILYEFRNEPIVLYSKGGFTEGDTLISPAAGAGSTALRFPMERWGIKYKYLFNAHDTPMDTAGILEFGRAARAMKLLRKTRVGIIGFNDMGLYTTGFNVTNLRGVTGVEVESIDMLQLDRKINSLSEKRVNEEIKNITQDWEYPLGKPSDEAIEKSIRLYLATIDICEEKNFSAISYKCVEGLPAHMGIVHSVPSALVATAGYPYVDEDDVGNLVAELMLKYVSGGETVTFLEHYEHHPEWILLGVDGMVPMQMIEGKRMVKSISTVLLQGLVFCSRMKTGRMTCACLSEDPSSVPSGYRLHLATGEGKEAPQWVEMGVPLPSWPSVRFFPDSSVRSILDHVQSQHFAIVYGNYANEIQNLCNLLNIQTIVDR